MCTLSWFTLRTSFSRKTYVRSVLSISSTAALHCCVRLVGLSADPVRAKALFSTANRYDSAKGELRFRLHERDGEREFISHIPLSQNMPGNTKLTHTHMQPPVTHTFRLTHQHQCTVSRSRHMYLKSSMAICVCGRATATFAPVAVELLSRIFIAVLL